MKNSEILELSNEELAARLVEEKAALSKLKFAHAVSAIENPSVIKVARRNVARLTTEQTKRTAAAKVETAAEAQN